MRFTIILALAAAALAAPAPSTLSTQVAKAFDEAPECTLPEAGANCAGALNKDVVVAYGNNFTQAEKDMYLNAAKAAGANILGSTDLVFYGFVPEPVVTLFRTYGESCGLKVADNGCMGIPWCGESPC